MFSYSIIVLGPGCSSDVAPCLAMPDEFLFVFFFLLFKVGNVLMSDSESDHIYR